MKIDGHRESHFADKHQIDASGVKVKAGTYGFVDHIQVDEYHEIHWRLFLTPQLAGTVLGLTGTSKAVRRSLCNVEKRHEERTCWLQGHQADMNVPVNCKRNYRDLIVVTKKIMADITLRTVINCPSVTYMYGAGSTSYTSLMIKQLAKPPLDSNCLNVREKGES